MHASNPRRCDPCIVPANLALDCFLCGSFDLCEKCFGSGKRCARGHEMISGLCAIDSSNAPDLLNNSPSKTPFDANYCYNCQAPANQGVFYRKRETDPIQHQESRKGLTDLHRLTGCCNCEEKSGSRNFNLCHACYASGARCKDPDTHVLVLCLMDARASLVGSEVDCKLNKMTHAEALQGGRCDICDGEFQQGCFFRELSKSGGWWVKVSNNEAG